MGPEAVALVGVAIAGATMLGGGLSSAIKALWSISKKLGAFEGKILEILNRHDKELQSLDQRTTRMEERIK